MIDEATEVSEELWARIAALPNIEEVKHLNAPTYDPKPSILSSLYAADRMPSGRDRIRACDSEAAVEKELRIILETYTGASNSTRAKLRKCAAARIRDLRSQAESAGSSSTAKAAK